MSDDKNENGSDTSTDDFIANHGTLDTEHAGQELGSAIGDQEFLAPKPDAAEEIDLEAELAAEVNDADTDSHDSDSSDALDENGIEGSVPSEVIAEVSAPISDAEIAEAESKGVDLSFTETERPEEQIAEFPEEQDDYDPEAALHLKKMPVVNEEYQVIDEGFQVGADDINEGVPNNGNHTVDEEGYADLMGESADIEGDYAHLMGESVDVEAAYEDSDALEADTAVDDQDEHVISNESFEPYESSEPKDVSADIEVDEIDENAGLSDEFLTEEEHVSIEDDYDDDSQPFVIPPSSRRSGMSLGRVIPLGILGLVGAGLIYAISAKEDRRSDPLAYDPIETSVQARDNRSSAMSAAENVYNSTQQPYLDAESTDANDALINKIKAKQAEVAQQRAQNLEDDQALSLEATSLETTSLEAFMEQEIRETLPESSKNTDVNAIDQQIAELQRESADTEIIGDAQRAARSRQLKNLRIVGLEQQKQIGVLEERIELQSKAALEQANRQEEAYNRMDTLVAVVTKLQKGVDAINKRTALHGSTSAPGLRQGYGNNYGFSVNGSDSQGKSVRKEKPAARSNNKAKATTPAVPTRTSSVAAKVIKPTTHSDWLIRSATLDRANIVNASCDARQVQKGDFIRGFGHITEFGQGYITNSKGVRIVSGNNPRCAERPKIAASPLPKPVSPEKALSQLGVIAVPSDVSN